MEGDKFTTVGHPKSICTESGQVFTVSNVGYSSIESYQLRMRNLQVELRIGDSNEENIVMSPDDAEMLALLLMQKVKAARESWQESIVPQACMLNKQQEQR